MQIESACFVHSWRTLVVALSVVNITHSRHKTVFLCTRKLSDVCKQYGLNTIDLDPYFAIPYSYISKKEDWINIRNFCHYLQDLIPNARSLYIPHAQDPMMQLLIACLKYEELYFIEEGSLFPEDKTAAVAQGKMFRHSL